MSSSHWYIVLFRRFFKILFIHKTKIVPSSPLSLLIDHDGKLNKKTCYQLLLLLLLFLFNTNHFVGTLANQRTHSSTTPIHPLRSYYRISLLTLFVHTKHVTFMEVQYNNKSGKKIFERYIIFILYIYVFHSQTCKTTHLLSIFMNYDCNRI